jgi:uncharacterized damage-inducible protein DinB
MNDLGEAVDVLARTPAVLYALLGHLSQPWLQTNEGPNTWSPHDVVSHLIHADKTNWIVRTRGILKHGEGYTFEPFDRFGTLEANKQKPTEVLLQEFTKVREQSLLTLRGFELSESDLAKTATHPEFGEVTLKQVLATWVVHDLDHLGQIARTMARQYEAEVGPWQTYLSILNKRS